MTETNAPIKIHRGLKGVYFDRSPCTFIDGRIGELRYRGYSIHDLAEHSSFEETAWLLLHGELPSKSQLAEFDLALKAARELPAPIVEIIRTIKHARIRWTCCALQHRRSPRSMPRLPIIRARRCCAKASA